MAPYLLALFLFAAEAPVVEAPAAAEAPADGPVATAIPRKQDVAALPIQGGPVAAPTDDYGYVGWCYGALAGYVDLYERAMPEVERIERAWPTPSTEENIKIIYPGQRAEARETLPELKRAMDAAEKASPTPIQNQGAAAIKKGRAVWTGATTVPPAQLAQFWMSWSPPAKCEETAKTLEARSNVFGQALSANIDAAPAPLREETAVEGTEVAAAPSAIDDLVPATADDDVAVEATPTDDSPTDAVKDEAAPADEALPANEAPPEEAPPALRGPQ